MPDWAAAVLVIAGCAVLAWAGLEKVRDREPLTGTVAALGVGPRLAACVAIVVPVVELGTVLAVVAGAPALATAALFAALGTGFAAVAGWSLATRRRISCACFGSSGATLGWRQVAALPLWTAVAWAAVAVPPSSARDRLVVLAAGMVILSGLRAVPVIRRGLAARADRRAMAGG